MLPEAVKPQNRELKRKEFQAEIKETMVNAINKMITTGGVGFPMPIDAWPFISDGLSENSLNEVMNHYRKAGWDVRLTGENMITISYKRD